MRAAVIERTTDAEIQRLAAQLVSSWRETDGPYNVPLLRWAVEGLGPDAMRDPVRYGGLLIDAALSYYDKTQARYFERKPVVVCFGPCALPDAGCVGAIDGVEVRHLGNGGWGVNGVAFPADRVQAERCAMKLATLRKLAREWGIEGQ